MCLGGGQRYLIVGFTSPKALNDTVDGRRVEYVHIDGLVYEMGVLLLVIGVDFYIPT